MLSDRLPLLCMCVCAYTDVSNLQGNTGERGSMGFPGVIGMTGQPGTLIDKAYNARCFKILHPFV